MKAKVIATSELANVTRKVFWKVAGEASHAQKAAQLRERYFGKLRFPKNPRTAEPPPQNTEVVPNGSALSGLGVSRAFQYFGMRKAELNQAPIRGLAVEERKTFLFWPAGRLIPLLEDFNRGDLELVHAVYVGGGPLPTVSVLSSNIWS